MRTCAKGFEATKREGLASFGDDRVFIEKFIESPRHIEIQVLGDQHGNIVYLGERECSIQRRHQKVVEEAPSPFVTPEMRKAMGEQAVALARRSAITARARSSSSPAPTKSFYFLEMNTRLQVEHPVTEQITGLDLVEQMIRVAYGEKLTFGQKDVKLNGWSIENRRLCRRPLSRLPALDRPPGPLPPAAEGEGVRVDDGVAEGGEVSMFYDPMIAKLITSGATREEAIDRQIAALDAFEIEGIGHNVDFLSALMQHPRFRSGELTTGFIAEEYPDGFHGAPPTRLCSPTRPSSPLWRAMSRSEAAPSAASSMAPSPRRTCASSASPAPSTASASKIMKAASSLFSRRWPRTRSDTGARASPCSRARSTAAPARSRSRAGPAVAAHHARRRAHRRRAARACRHPLAPHDRENPARPLEVLICPMPGLLTALHVGAGDHVEAGQPLATVEAMKMENILRAEKSGTVKAINAKPGDSLAVDAVILEFE